MQTITPLMQQVFMDLCICQLWSILTISLCGLNVCSFYKSVWTVKACVNYLSVYTKYIWTITLCRIQICINSRSVLTISVCIDYRSSVVGKSLLTIKHILQLYGYSYIVVGINAVSVSFQFQYAAVKGDQEDVVGRGTFCLVPWGPLVTGLIKLLKEEQTSK